MPGTGLSSRSTPVRRMMGFARVGPSNVINAFCVYASRTCSPHNGMTQPTSRQGRLGASEGTQSLAAAQLQVIVNLPCRAVRLSSGARASGPIKTFAGFQHRVHDDSEFARYGDRRPLEADLLPKLQSPGSERAVGKASRQDHRRSLIQETPKMTVATPRDMPIKVNLSRLVAPGGEAQPRAHGTRCPEVLRSLDRCREGGCNNRADTRYRHE